MSIVVLVEFRLCSFKVPLSRLRQDVWAESEVPCLLTAA